MPKSLHRGPPSDHFDGRRFFNPGRKPEDERGLRDLWRWRREGQRQPWPALAPSPFQDRPPKRVDDLRIVLIGHSSLLVQVDGLNILVDPIWSERASPFSFAGPRRANPPGIGFDDLPPIDVVLLSHGHYDHLDTATLRRLQERHRPRVIAPLGHDPLIRRAAEGVRVETGDWFDRFQLGSSLEVTLVPASHWSSRTPWDRNLALWCGFVLGTRQGPVYIAGDTGFGDGALFDGVRERFGSPRAAVLPIGAYEPRWFMRPQHMNPADAVEAFRRLGTAQALGCHWGTFQLTDEAIEAPAEALAVALKEAGVAPNRFIALRPGQAWVP